MVPKLLPVRLRRGLGTELGKKTFIISLHDFHQTAVFRSYSKVFLYCSVRCSSPRRI